MFWATMKWKMNKGHGNRCLMVIVGALSDLERIKKSLGLYIWMLENIKH
jgi:hypothetical protein